MATDLIDFLDISHFTEGATDVDLAPNLTYTKCHNCKRLDNGTVRPVVIPSIFMKLLSADTPYPQLARMKPSPKTVLLVVHTYAAYW